jgi:heme exporter protein C
MGVYYALFQSPPDYQQGEMVRFLYLHVPASWFALLVYTLMMVCSVLGFVFKMSLAHVWTKALAPSGCLLTCISLVTGSLWGKPVWGTYWVWDARLTSMLILGFLYLGYTVLAYQKIIVHDAMMRPALMLKRLNSLSILIMIGFINIPIIKWSVDFWFTLHQPPSLMRLAKPALDAAFFPPLLWMAAAYLCFTIAMFCLCFQGIYKNDFSSSSRR